MSEPKTTTAKWMRHMHPLMSQSFPAGTHPPATSVYAVCSVLGENCFAMFVSPNEWQAYGETSTNDSNPRNQETPDVNHAH